MKEHKFLAGLCLAALLGVHASSARADEPASSNTEVAFSIEAQPLSQALSAFGQQSGIPVLFYSEIGSGLTAGPLVGTFTPRAALRQLLSNTGLTYSTLNSGAVAIHSATEAVAIERSAPSQPTVMRLAQAQTAQASGAEAAASRPSASDARRAPRVVEEVIVTARKRAESIHDVPISITAITSEEIDRRGLVSSGDYLRGVPGVSQVDSAEGQSVVIRGMETSPYFQNFSSGPTTATYFGETPTTTAGGLGTSTNVDIKLVDIDRVEVLRGPQGTAFGNSSLGGAVRVIPRAPDLQRVEAKVAAGYSVTEGSGGDNYNLNGVANLPVVEGLLALRASAYQYEDSGFYNNRAGSDPAFQAAAVLPFGAQAFASDQEEAGAYQVKGGRAALLLQATDRLQVTLNYLSQKSESDGMTLASSGPYDQTMLQVAPEHVFRGERHGVSDIDVDIANATLGYELGWADLTATYSYTESTSAVAAPYQLSGRFWPVSYISESDHRENVGEIRLATSLKGPWNAVAGFYTEELTDGYFTDYRWFGAPSQNIACPACAGRSHIGDQLQDWRLRQDALFGELSWEFLPTLTLTGGVRAYQYDRSIAIRSPSGFFFAPAAPGTTTTSTDADGENFKANLSYKPDPGVHVYAGWSQGFRVGKPQAALPAGACDLDADGVIDGTAITLESTGSIDSDDVDNYEIGGKFALLDRRLIIDAAVFRMEWSGLPVRVGTPAPCNRAYNTNAGEALSEGVELQASFRFAEPFRLDVGGSYIRARLTEDVPLQNFSSGDRLPGSPEVNANLGLQYEFGLGTYNAVLRTDSSYVGSFYGDVLESPNTKSGGYVKVDASARLELGSVNLDLYIRNLTNEDAFTFRGILPASAARPGLGEYYGYRLRPRTIGFQLGYTF